MTQRLPPHARRGRDTTAPVDRPNGRRGFQIGPKIRIGGSVGHLAQEAKIGTGKVLSNKLVDMGLSLIPGVGPGIATAANAAGHVLDTSGGGIHTLHDLGGVAKDAALTYAGSKALGAAKGAIVKDGVFGAAKKLVTGGGSDGEGSFGEAGDLAGTLVDHGKQLLGLGGGGSSGGGGNGGMFSNLANDALMAGAVAQTAADRQKQAQMLDEAKGYAVRSYDARSPLRTQALAALTDPTSAANRPADLSSIYANPGSVYNKIGPKVPMAVPS